MTAELGLVTDLRPVAQLRPVVEFTVRGLPVPQGNARAFMAGGRRTETGERIGGKAVLVTQANRPNTPLGAWRVAVREEAQRAMGETSPMLQGPLGLLVTFVLPRPASTRGRLYPAVRPDLDKLLRAVADALKGVVWRDDSQVVTIAARKVYGETPGCRVGVTHPADELLTFDWGVS